MGTPIKIVFDNSLVDEPVIDILVPSSPDEATDSALVGSSTIQLTKATGIIAPLIKINKTIVEYSSVINFSLRSEGFLPEMTLTVLDTFNFITSLDTPGADNKVIIEILPDFDKIYKKIKLYFYITGLYANKHDNTVSLKCVYNIPGLMDSRLESFGKISTYDFYNKVARSLSLGFASNVDNTDDERYIYLSNENYISSMKKEISQGGSAMEVLSGWVDFWNNLNIANIHERYTAIDEELKIFVSDFLKTPEPDNDYKPTEISAEITNNPFQKLSHMFVEDYIITSSMKSNVSRGTDRMINIYNFNTDKIESSLVQDGSGVKKDIFKKSYYLGEAIGERTNYLIQPEFYNMFMQKISNNTLTVTLPKPNHGLMRGHRVNLIWFELDEFKVKMMAKNSNMKSNVPLPNIPDDFVQENSIILNKKISGQYLITAVSINYENDNNILNFTQTLTLARPNDGINYSDLNIENS